MSNGTPTTVPQAVLNFLKSREGFKTIVYKDSLGKPTAGLGHLLTAQENAQYAVGDTVPDATLNAWATADSMGAYKAAVAQAAQLEVTSTDFIVVLTSVNFQMGTAWNTKKFPNTWAIMMSHQWEKAAEALDGTIWSKQTPTRVRDFQAALRALIVPSAPVVTT